MVFTWVDVLLIYIHKGFVMAFYSSHGAAGEVTGSCHLLEIGHIQILIDCGLFQGQEEAYNYEDFDFDPKEINYLIVTHAHLDHIGRIPLLVKRGFKGEIISTKATYDLAKLMLKNAAGILKERRPVLYDFEDVESTFLFPWNFLDYNDSIELEENIKVTFKNAGHILGSATVKIEYFEENMNKSVVFSGDIGQTPRIITSKIDFWEEANYIFVESTYAGRFHKELTLSINEFKEKIVNTLNNNGVVLLPSFALERTQEILYILKQMSKEKLLENVTVYLDSPLAIDVTKTFLKHPELLNNQLRKAIKREDNPFDFKELVQTYTREESMLINTNEGKKIIIAGSGMCEGGRIPHHILRYASDKRNMILFVGYQVKGTLGKKILEDKLNISIEEKEIDIHAKIDMIDGFSAHADQEGLLEFLKAPDNIYCIYLIHGDVPRLTLFKDIIHEELKDKAHIVKMKEKIYI